MFAVILGGILLGSVRWWAWADRRLRPYRRLRLLVAVFVGAHLLFLASHFVVPDVARRWHHWLPAPWIATVYLWHLIVVPLSLLAALLWGLTPRRRPAAADVEARRRFLGACAAVAPAVVAGAGGFLSLGRLGHFRVRRLDLPIPGLPRGLDGATIAHVSDVHVGKFSSAAMLSRVVDATNALEADLVLFTGDLIDLSLADLDEGIDFVKRLDPRRGLFLCEGNHDLIDDGPEFRRRVAASGLPLLIDRGETVLVRDEPVEVLGLAWSRAEPAMADGIRALRDRRDGEAFPILLAHHPHAFDHAPGFPLVLAGHTHGGLLNFTDRVGAGPLLYRYWSGAYERDGRTVVVSNGVGTWFPLRVNAPAEILHLTLRQV